MLTNPPPPPYLYQEMDSYTTQTRLVAGTTPELTYTNSTERRGRVENRRTARNPPVGAGLVKYTIS
jgi:hypothetical protein